MLEEFWWPCSLYPTLNFDSSILHVEVTMPNFLEFIGIEFHIFMFPCGLES